MQVKSSPDISAGVQNFPDVSWEGDAAAIGGRIVGVISQTPSGFHWEAVLASGEVLSGERLRRRDARSQIERLWQRQHAKLDRCHESEQTYRELVTFCNRLGDDHVTGAVADRIISAFAAKNGIHVRRMTSCYTAWRLSRNGQARDLRWAVVKQMGVLDLLDILRLLIDDAARN